LRRPTLPAFVAAEHLVVSHTGDANGFVDVALATHGMTRRVALTAPNFILALALVADGDLLAAVPRSLFELHGARFKLGCAKPPLALPGFALNAVAPKPALQDAGLRWLIETLALVSGGAAPRRKKA